VVIQLESAYAGEGTGATILQIIALRSSTGIVQTIRTMAEHPAHVLGKGWIKAGTLQPGDQIGGPSPPEARTPSRDR
jgi:hypothetical protein